MSKVYKTYNFNTIIVENVIRVRFKDQKFSKKLLNLNDKFSKLHIKRKK